MGPGEPAPARPHPLRPHGALASRSLPGEACSAAPRARPPPRPPPPHFPIGRPPGPGPRRSSGEAELDSGSSGEEGWAPFLSNALGRGWWCTPCTSLRCDRVTAGAAAAAACGSERLAEGSPLLPEARCLEPGVSSVALVCRRFPCAAPQPSDREERRGPGLDCRAGLPWGDKPRPAAAVSRPRLRVWSWLGRPFRGRTVSKPVVSSDRAWKWRVPFWAGGGSGSGGSGDSFSSLSADPLLNVAAGAVSRPADVAVGSECRCAWGGVVAEGWWVCWVNARVRLETCARAPPWTPQLETLAWVMAQKWPSPST